MSKIKNIDQWIIDHTFRCDKCLSLFDDEFDLDDNYLCVDCQPDEIDTGEPEHDD